MNALAPNTGSHLRENNPRHYVKAFKKTEWFQLNAFADLRMQPTNACQQQDKHHSRGLFRKFSIKVIEWIRKSLALGKNEVKIFIT